MRRGGRIAIVLLIILAGLLVINMIVLDNETRDAEVTVDGAELFETEGGVELQYTDEPASGAGQEGQPIVLLHCYTCSMAWWDELAPLLAERHRVVTVDLIGHGGSEKPSSGYEISGQSAAVAALLNDLGVRGATVVGHSMGGYVATSLAEQASELVDRVVLIGSSSEAGQSELPVTARLATTPVIGEAIWRVMPDGMVKSASSEAFAPGFSPEEAFPDDPDRVVIDIDAMTYTSFKQAREASSDFVDEQSPAARLSATGVPVLAIVGTEDQLLDVDETIAGFQTIPGARTVTIDGSGHSPNIEKPEETAEEILPFAAAGEEFTAPEPQPDPQQPAPKPKPEPKPAQGGGGDKPGGGGKPKG